MTGKLDDGLVEKDLIALAVGAVRERRRRIDALQGDQDLDQRPQEAALLGCVGLRFGQFGEPGAIGGAQWRELLGGDPANLQGQMRRRFQPDGLFGEAAKGHWYPAAPTSPRNTTVSQNE